MATPPVAPGFQNQQFGQVERVERMPVPPRPMQPRPSLVVGGPAFFTPEGYQAPVQPEQAFMPTDRRPDPIGDNFSRPYERPIMPMPMPRPIDVPQDRAPVVPIEQPKAAPPVGSGPVRPMPMPMPQPTPQPKYDPFAYSDLGKRALGGEFINRMTFYYFDPTTGKSGSTTQGYSRVPDSAKPYIYLNKEEADRARDKFLEYEDTGGAETPEPRRTPVTIPTPAQSMPMPSQTTPEYSIPLPHALKVFSMTRINPEARQQLEAAMNERKAFDRSDVAGSLKRGATPSQQDILSVYTPYLLGSKNPEKTLGEIKALEDAGFALEGATPTSDIKTQSQKNKRGISFTNFVPKAPQLPSLLVPPITPKPIPTPILDD